MAEVIKKTITDKTLKREMFRVINEAFSHAPSEFDIHLHGETTKLSIIDVSYSYEVNPSVVEFIDEDGAKRLLKAIFEEEKEDGYEEDEEEGE